MSNKKIIELDYIRGISCVMILLYHYTTQYCQIISDLDYPIRFNWGCYAVATFFILSGFLSFYTAKSDFNFRNYLKTKAIRLYPVYWICMIITIVICLMFLPKYSVSIKDFLINLTMLTELFKGKYVDGAYWTLLRELIFYVLIGIIFKLNLKNKMHYFSLVWILMLIAMHFISANHHNLVITFFNYLLICKYGHHFILGIMVYFIVNSRSIKEFIVPIINCLFCIIYQALSFSIQYTVFVIVLFLIVLFVALNSKYCFYSLNEKTTKLLSPLAFLASISYAVYLIHQNFGYAIINLFESYGITSEIVILIPIFLSIIIGFVLHKFIEIPSTKKLKKVFINSKN